MPFYRHRTRRARPQPLTGADRLVSNLRNGCVPRMIKGVSGKSDEEVISACEQSGGWKHHHGMHGWQREKAWKILGVQFKEVVFKVMPKVQYDSLICDSGFGAPDDRHIIPVSGKSCHPTVGTIAKMFPRGVFCVLVARHAFYMRDGVIHDGGRRGAGRKVQSLVEILNPVEVVKGDFIRVVRHDGRRAGTASGAKYREVTKLIAELGGKAKRETILNRTSYRPCDLDYDLKLGHLEMCQ